MRQEGLQVLIRPFRFGREAPVACVLADPCSDVLIAGTRVVDGDRVATGATKGLIDRQAGRLAVDVPEGHVDGRIAANLCASPLVSDVGDQRLRDPFDPKGVNSQELPRGCFVDVRRDGLRAEEALSESDQPLVRVETHKGEVRELSKPYRLYSDDLHCIAPGISRDCLHESSGTAPGRNGGDTELTTETRRVREKCSITPEVPLICSPPSAKPPPWSRRRTRRIGPQTKRLSDPVHETRALRS